MFKIFKKKKKQKQISNISIEDIKDDDMMVAVLVATIDFSNEKIKDVRLVSVKKI